MQCGSLGYLASLPPWTSAVCSECTTREIPSASAIHKMWRLSVFRAVSVDFWAGSGRLIQWWRPGIISPQIGMLAGAISSGQIPEQAGASSARGVLLDARRRSHVVYLIVGAAPEALRCHAAMTRGSLAGRRSVPMCQHRTVLKTAIGAWLPKHGFVNCTVTNKRRYTISLRNA